MHTVLFSGFFVYAQHHPPTRDFSWCHDSQGVDPVLLSAPTDDCFNAMCLLLLLLTDCTLTSATVTMLLLQLTHIGPCINAQQQESVWG